MQKLAVALALLSGLLLADGVSAQELLLDQWTEDFLAGQKVGYAHIRIHKRPGGYLEERNEWWPLAGDTYREQSVIRTNNEGRIQSAARTIRTALGTTISFAEQEGKGLRWQMRYRRQKPLSGKIEGEVQDSSLVAFLLARGPKKSLEVKLRSLDLPEGAREKTYRANSRPGFLSFEHEDVLRLYDRQGALLQELRYDMHAERLKVSEVQAKDMTRVLPGLRESGIEPGVARSGGMTLTSPGPGWGVVAMPEGQGEESSPRVMLLHPYRVLFLARPISIALPADEEGLGNMADRMGDALSKGDTKYRVGKATKAWGLSGLHYETEGVFRGEETLGEAWLLHTSASESLMVVLFGPSDKARETASLLRAAKASFQFRALRSYQSASFPGGLKLRLPQVWRKGETKGRAAWTSPQGGYLTAWVQFTPNHTPLTFLKDWALQTAARLKGKPGGLKRVEIDGRSMFKIEVDAEKAGTRMKVRLITTSAGPGQTLLLIAIDTAQSPRGDMDWILGSATWGKE